MTFGASQRGMARSIETWLGDSLTDAQQGVGARVWPALAQGGRRTSDAKRNPEMRDGAAGGSTRRRPRGYPPWDELCENSNRQPSFPPWNPASDRWLKIASRAASSAVARAVHADASAVFAAAMAAA